MFAGCLVQVGTGSYSDTPYSDNSYSAAKVFMQVMFVTVGGVTPGNTPTVRAISSAVFNLSLVKPDLRNLQYPQIETVFAASMVYA